ncbi:MAG: anti-sigma factor [Micrococcales bacterium]|nr:anti-sigma factor [Micrococcales bacterium]
MTRPDARDSADRDLTGAYALSALAPAERAAFERYLETDEAARTEAVELGDTAVYLGLAVPAEQPPVELKSRLFAMLDATPQLAPEAETEGDADVAVAPVIPLGSARSVTSGVSAPGRIYRFSTRSVAMLAAAAAVLAAVVVGGIAIRPTVAPDERSQAISQLRDAPDVRTARSSVDGGGTAEVMWSTGQRRAAITVSDLKSLSAAQVYELWFIDAAGNPTRAGTFTMDGSSKTMLLSGKMTAGDSIGVTVEPKGGSDAPTTTPIVVVETA